MENRIAELKHDLGADGFCLKQFFATEAAFRAVLLLFNLLAEFQRAAGLPGYREPATIRTQVLTCGAILGRAGRRLVIHLSQSWGGLANENPFAGQHLALGKFQLRRSWNPLPPPDPQPPAKKPSTESNFGIQAEGRLRRGSIGGIVTVTSL